MPNGRRQLDCSYCIHFDGEGYPDGHAEARLCRFHETILPKPRMADNNRICGNFEPSAVYGQHGGGEQFCTLARRFAWFGADLKPGVLYEFSQYAPPEITELAVLRIPDYHNRTWIKPAG
jgi:hypothetical protein